jgi:hypothetical protein
MCVCVYIYIYIYIYIYTYIHIVGRDGVVGIATRYGLDGPGIESRWGRDFPHPSWGLPNLLSSGYWVSFSGVKRPERGANHPPPSSAEVKETVQLHLYSPSGPSWCSRANFTFTYIYIYTYMLSFILYILRVSVTPVTIFRVSYIRNTRSTTVTGMT